MAEPKEETKNTPALKVGWLVALTVKEDMSPMRCYVGRIRAIDERGVLMTLIDSVTGHATGDDLFFSWPDFRGGCELSPWGSDQDER